MSKRRPILCFLVLPCVAASFPEYPVKPTREYATAIEKSGLVVAAVPVEDREDQRRYFGIDVRSKGFVPVLLVIENRASDDSFLLKKESLMYSRGGRSGSTLPNAARSSGADKTAIAIASVPTIYTFMLTIAVSRVKELRQHLLRTEFQSATLSPGASVHGFVFIPVHWGYSSREKIQLTVPFARSGSNDIVTIESTF